MNRHFGILVALIVLVSGCSKAAPPPAATESTAATSTSSAPAQNPQAAGGNFPDPCTLLSDAEVTQLTGRDITQIDKDGADTSAVTRYCQWQQSSGQLAVFLSRTTPDDFTVANNGAPAVAGVGEAAYFRDGHLYVLDRTIQLDVYARGGDDAQSQAEAIAVANALLPKLASFA